MQIQFTTIEKLTHLVDFDKPLMYDSETIKFYGRIRLAQFYQRHFIDKEGEPIVYIVEYPTPHELVMLLSKAEVVCHNVHYDITTIQEQLGKLVWMPDLFHCTFLLSRLHFVTKDSFSLDNVIEYTLGHNPYGPNKKDLQKSDWSVPVLSDDQISYAARDVLYLHDVWDTVSIKLDDYSYKLDMISTRDCLEFQNFGLPIDLERTKDKYAKNMKEINEINLPINCNSYKQVRAYIDSNLSDDHGLSLLTLQGNERAANVNKARKLIKNNSFLTKYLNIAQPHETDDGFGIIHGKFKNSARSGRLTSDDENLQQIPRALKILFGVPEESDEIILFSDFAQIQLRAVTAVTGDKAMEKLFREGKDLHDYVATLIFGPNFTKEQRQISKTANFSLLFGAGVAVFIKMLIKQAKMWLKENEANKIRSGWLKLWKEIKEWQELGIKDWRKGKVWSTPLGREYKAKMMTDQLAMQIQGFEAEVAKLARHYMKPRLLAISPLIRLRNFVHDSFIFTAPNDATIYIPAMEIIAECMQEAWFEMSQAVAITDLPMPVKVRAGWNWGDIEKDQFVHEITR
jgi:hypothetical protein